MKISMASPQRLPRQLYNPNDAYDMDIDGVAMDITDDNKLKDTKTVEDVDCPGSGPPRSLVPPVTWLISFLRLCFRMSSHIL